MERLARFAQSVAFVLRDGLVVYPVRRVNPDTWQRTFRIAFSSAARDAIAEVEHEDDLVRLLMRHRYAVCCADSNGVRQGLYSPDHEEVVSVVVHDP